MAPLLFALVDRRLAGSTAGVGTSQRHTVAHPFGDLLGALCFRILIERGANGSLCVCNFRLRLYRVGLRPIYDFRSLHRFSLPSSNDRTRSARPKLSCIAHPEQEWLDDSASAGNAHGWGVSEMVSAEGIEPSTY
jgi:hypothetical protein